MPHLKIVKISAYEQHGTALIASDDSVWVAIAPRWWDIASWLWWWLCPNDKKAFVTLTLKSGNRLRSRAIRVAKQHVRIRNMPITLQNDMSWSDSD